MEFHTKTNNEYALEHKNHHTIQEVRSLRRSCIVYQEHRIDLLVGSSLIQLIR